MATHNEMSDALIALFKRRTGLFGKWIPTNCWINKLEVEGLDNKRLKKALEISGTFMTKIEDSTHGHLFIEMTTRKFAGVGTKWFIGCFTRDHPNEHLGNLICSERPCTWHGSDGVP